MVVIAVSLGGCHNISRIMQDAQPASGPDEREAGNAGTSSRRVSGAPVPDTGVAVAQDVRAGGSIRVRAPAGSRVETETDSLDVPASGTVLIAAPLIPGEIRVRVTRPDGRVLSVVVQVR